MTTAPISSAPVVALVEPDAAVSALLSEVLTGAGVRTVCWPPGAPITRDTLCTFLTAHAPAAVLLDVAPPYAEKWQLVQHALQLLPDLPVLAMTTDPAALSGLPGNDRRVPVLTKPFDLDGLLITLQRMLCDAHA